MTKENFERYLELTKELFFQMREAGWPEIVLPPGPATPSRMICGRHPRTP